jgi:UDP-N-acetylglucosamine acyltransferase
MVNHGTVGARIHPTAIVEAGAEIGADVSVGPFTVIEAGAEVADGCVIGPHAVIHGSTALGPRCTVHAGAILGDLPQDLAFAGGPSRVQIGADCVVREGVTVHRGTRPDSVTRVGDGCMLMAFAHIAHNVELGARVIVCNGALLAGYVHVGSDAFVSGNCVVHQFVHIGRLAMLGGGCGVSKDVPPFCTVRPVSANRILGLNLVGLKRAGLGPQQRRAVKQAFGLLYRAGVTPREAAELIESELDDPLAREIAAFARASARGICPLRFG